MMLYRNYMEDAALEELDEVLDRMDGFCGCEKCRNDMAAWALNRLSPKYVATGSGAIYTKLEQLKAQSRADVVMKLMEAAKVVKAHPRH